MVVNEPYPFHEQSEGKKKPSSQKPYPKTRIMTSLARPNLLDNM